MILVKDRRCFFHVVDGKGEFVQQVFLFLFFLANALLPFCTPDMIGDFKACGGFIMLATGFRMVKLLDFPIADMLPAMILVMPFSALWTSIF